MLDITRGRGRKGEKGFTLIELLVVAAIIGILLALAIPNLLKARISANEANARKVMQTLRDAESEYFEQDLDDDGERNYTGMIGANGTPKSLRQPGDSFNEQDALIDSSFEGADAGAAPSTAICTDSKAGYCVGWDSNIGDETEPQDNFGWKASMTSFNQTGRKDFAVYGDAVIRCTVDATLNVGNAGKFLADGTSPGCD